MAWNENSRRAETEDLYAGPEEIMEAGVRGFLVTTLHEKEELGLDQAMKMLRKACIKLYGGMKPESESIATYSNGYVIMDFMDPATAIEIPNPNMKPKDETSNQEDESNTSQKEDDNNQKETELNPKEDKEEAMETEGGQEKEETPQTDKDENQGEETSTADGDTEVTKDSEETKDKEKKETDKENEEKESEKSYETKEEDRSRDRKRKRKEEKAPKLPLMKTTYKFKAFRTEFRNMMFIKSDVPEPVKVAAEVMDLTLNKKPLRGDAINQLLPILGICDYSYWELEVMSKRVLAPFFPEDVEELPCFSLMVLDKLNEPGTDLLMETVRNVIWGHNPNAWMCHPLCEPQVMIQLELIGSKIVLSVMPYFMKYRQYCPFVLSELGEGKFEALDDFGRSLGTQRIADAEARSRNDKRKNENQRTEKESNDKQETEKTDEENESKEMEENDEMTGDEEYAMKNGEDKKETADDKGSEKEYKKRKRGCAAGLRRALRRN